MADITDNQNAAEVASDAPMPGFHEWLHDSIRRSVQMKREIRIVRAYDAGAKAGDVAALSEAAYEAIAALRERWAEHLSGEHADG